MYKKLIQLFAVAAALIFCFTLGIVIGTTHINPEYVLRPVWSILALGSMGVCTLSEGICFYLDWKENKK